MSVLLSLKIGARTYEVTEQTRFFCNASTVQMLDTGLKQPPVLRAKHIKQINQFERLQHDHTFGQTISVFSLK
ncbi:MULTISPECIES: hypothetical protein [Pseudoalteromonas]|uniref:hypothetical protein n=1 Tax=Pseudoalteromonas TaxID=53246 RepID=UPI00158418F9|nr:MULTISPECIES: hypothetical protein [Pseudoalteromonas]MDI4654572.1 hypothetical protein [Pseudoalteromonas shioyasakiensis]NUJ40159.1 hypothetical protein [Pseudoalteromonas sp. 0303]